MKILVIKLGALGDVIMATPLIEAIQRAHHVDRLSFLTIPRFAPIFERWVGLHTVSFSRRGIVGWFAALRWIRAGAFDRVYDLQGNDRTGLWCALSGIPERVGNHCRFPYTHHPAEKWTGQCHIFERMQAVLASAGIEQVAARPILPVSAEDRRYVRDWMKEYDLESGAFALLHAGASPRWPSKVWPYFEQLAVTLEQHGVRVVWIGAAPDALRNATLAKRVGIDATDAFSVPSLAELGRAARFAVTNDSGPMHILSCAGVPVFGLFGPSNWRRNHALGQAGRVLACVDFAANFAGRPGADCLASIPCAAVWQRLAGEGLVG